jgi:hypothetical protein
MSNYVYATLTGHITPDLYIEAGSAFPADHPVVKARPDCFTKVEPKEAPSEATVEEVTKAATKTEAKAKSTGKTK